MISDVNEFLINVSVTDVNDNPPVFDVEHTPVYVPLASNFAIGRTVYSIIVSRVVIIGFFFWIIVNLDQKDMCVFNVALI